MISLENVSMCYNDGDDILSDLSFELDKGSFHFLMGNSGAGKSTLLKLMYLAHFPSRGQVSIMGQDVGEISRSELPLLRRKIGVVFQEFQLLEHMTVFDNVALPLRVMGRDEKQVHSVVDEILRWVGLADFMKVKPVILSGGQKQRVAIARAVVTNPDMLIADEPTGSVDEASARKLMRLFTALNDQGTTVVFATHSADLARRYAYPVLHLNHGQIDYYNRFDDAILGV